MVIRRTRLLPIIIPIGRYHDGRTSIIGRTCMNGSIGNIFRLAGIYAGGSVLQRALSIVMLVVYTHYLVPEDFGVLALLTVTTTLLTRTVSGVATKAFNRFYHAPAYADRKRLLVGNLGYFSLGQSIVLAAAYDAFAPTLDAWLFADSSQLSAVRVFGLIVLLEPLTIHMQRLLLMQERAGFQVKAAVVNQVLSAAITIGLFATTDMGVLAAAWGRVASVLINLVVFTPSLLRAADFAWRPRVLGEPLRYAYPQIVTGYANIMIESGDRYVLLVFLPVEAVGLYSFAYQVAVVLDQLLTHPAYMASTPTTLRMEDRPDELRAYVRASTTYFFAVAMFAWLGVALFAREAVTLLARQAMFEPASILIAPLALSYVLRAMGVFLDWGLVMPKKSAILSINIVAAAALNIALNFLLIPRFGLMGAAAATLISYVAWSAARAIQSTHYFAIRYDWRRMGMIVLLTGLLVAAGMAANQLPVVAAIAIKAALAAAYLPLLLVVGFFTVTERQAMRHAWTVARRDGFSAAVRRLRGDDRLDGDDVDQYDGA
jgi:O-antigen/teichoic acid export membrane protein